MPNLLPMIFIAFGALALTAMLFWFWQSLREALVHGAAQGTQASAVLSERAALLAEKKTLLLALKDLEAERDSGKLGDGDYEELNTRYRARAREVLAALDAQITPHRAAAQALIAQATTGQTPVSASKPPATASRAGICQSCGTQNDADAAFCKKCGQRVVAEGGA